MLKKILFIIFIPMILDASGGSLYTRNGVGDLFHTFSARRLGIGELGSAVADVEYISTLNPASWFSLGITRIETGINYLGMDIENNSDKAFYSETIFSGLTMGFPIDRDHGISLVLGLVPVTNVNYEVRDEITNNVLDETYTEIYKGDGGLSKIFIGTSYKLPFDWVIGASFEHYNGNITYSSKLDFEDFSSTSDAEFKREFTYSGIGTSLGIISSNLSNIFGLESIKDLRLGINFNYVSNLDTDSTLNAISVLGTNSFEKGTAETEIPYKLGIGLSFRLGAGYLIIADYLFQPWSNYKFNGIKSKELRDFQKISAAFEYRNPKGVFAGTFWEQIIFRGGLTFEQTQYEINNQGVNQFAVNAGFGIPIGIGNFLDFGFQYGVRGEATANLFKESFYKAAVTINFGELWFERIER